jgi:hypothetical protein
MSSPLLFCKTCNKPYTKGSPIWFLGGASTDSFYHVESSYKRHVAYCLRTQSRPRVRQRSCRGCSSAKSKCDFKSPCGRCLSKELVCLYEGTTTTKRPTSNLQVPAESNVSRSSPHENATDVIQSSLRRDAAKSDNMFLPFDRLADLLSCVDFPSYSGPNPILSSPEEIQSTFQQLNSCSDLELVMGSFVNNLTEVQAAALANSQAKYVKIRATSAMDADRFYTALGIPKSIMPQLNTSVLRTLKMGDPIAQHSAVMILQVFRSFPRMMLQRETYPCYIHPRWNEYSSGFMNLAHQEPLVNCMRIASIFTAKSHECRPSMWSMIRAEEVRFGEFVSYEFPNASE